MTDDDPYFWHRQVQTAVWRMPPCAMASSFTSRPRKCSSRSLALFDLYTVGAGKVVDVVFPVTMQRQALAVLFVLTVEVPQIQFFDVVGFQFWACGCALTSC